MFILLIILLFVTSLSEERDRMGRMITFLARIMEDSVGTDDEVGSVWGIGKSVVPVIPLQMSCV